jgi:uncharacterized protein YhfF
MIKINRLDHIQICIPFGKEEEARSFYTNILKFKEIPKPAELVKNGGLWYEVGDIQFHIGCEEETNNSKRHPAFEVENIKILRKYLEEQKVKIKEDITIPNCERFSMIDPFNNRIEFLEKSKLYADKISDFWEDFVSRNEEYKLHSIPSIDWFCNDEELTNQLANLVIKGLKTATCSALIDYQITKEDLPKVNDLKIIVDWHKNPICITKTKSVVIKKFNEIDEEFARKEGEGDKSLAYWQNAHKTFFSNYLKTLGVAFTDELKLVCEEFEKIG